MENQASLEPVRRSVLSLLRDATNNSFDVIYGDARNDQPLASAIYDNIMNFDSDFDSGSDDEYTPESDEISEDDEDGPLEE